MAYSFDKLEELELTRDEVDRIGNALKNEEFRRMLGDYVKEISSPENRKRYEEEITQLELERGNEITFIHPKPGYVIKTSVDGNVKGFVNICSNEVVEKPTSIPSIQDGTKGLQWSIPHTLSPPRDDIDNKHKLCRVYDVVFHPDTLHLSERNKAFRDMVNETALKAVEKSFNVALDTKNLKFPKLSYKGHPVPAVIRKPTGKVPEHSKEEQEFYDKLFADADKPKPVSKPKKKTVTQDEKSKYTKPTYVIKHRSHVDIQEFTYEKDSKINAATPKELIIEINLPLLKSSSDITLDVTDKTLQLISEKPAKYKLNLTLPYKVIEANGNAKFDKDQKKLTVTLPVKRHRSISLEIKDDSGVESDHNSPCEEEEEPVSVISSNSVQESKVFRTNVEFLDQDVHYNLPECTSKKFGTVLSLILQVKNVDEQSVQKLVGESWVHLKFISVSSSFYQTHYAFYIELEEQLKEEAISVEVWDNNVVLQLQTDSKVFKYGLDKNDLIEGEVNNEETKHELKEDEEEEVEVQNEKKEEEVKAIEKEEKPKEKEKSQAIDIVRRSYESSGDELSANSFSPSKSKGILKRGKRTVGRSISESSLDDYVCSSYENYFGNSLDSVIPEDGERDVASSSLKKTVRFNDFVMKQLFRSNSSILGQRKKNQRKARNKKRAQARRTSESENSEAEKEGDFKTKPEASTAEKGEFVNDDVFHLDMDH